MSAAARPLRVASDRVGPTSAPGALRSEVVTNCKSTILFPTPIAQTRKKSFSGHHLYACTLLFSLRHALPRGLARSMPPWLNEDAGRAWFLTALL